MQPETQSSASCLSLPSRLCSTGRDRVLPLLPAFAASARRRSTPKWRPRARLFTVRVTIWVYSEEEHPVVSQLAEAIRSLRIVRWRKRGWPMKLTQRGVPFRSRAKTVCLAPALISNAHWSPIVLKPCDVVSIPVTVKPALVADDQDSWRVSV